MEITSQETTAYIYKHWKEFHVGMTFFLNRCTGTRKGSGKVTMPIPSRNRNLQNNVHVGFLPLLTY